MIFYYNQKKKAYFTNIRLDIEPLLPHFSEKVLEIGCGNGATLSHYKGQKRFGFTMGLELVEEVTTNNTMLVDQWLIGSVEEIISQLEPNSLDLILCLDVLEHLVDPWLIVKELERVLKPGGYIVSSIPNMRTAKVIFDLVIRGNFDYTDQGILDKTHLRWFTRKTAIALFKTKNIMPIRWMHSPLPRKSKSAIINFVTFGVLRNYFTDQYLIKAQKLL